jgi:regulator of RNase E activity RraA
MGALRERYRKLCAFNVMVFDCLSHVVVSYTGLGVIVDLVNPGDILVGDDDGVIVADSAAFSAIADAAEAMQTREKSIRAAIEAGTSLFDLMTFSLGQA